MTVLVLSLALVLGLASSADAGLPHTVAGQHDIAGSHHASSPHGTCIQGPCSDRIADCCSSVAHCSGSGCSVLVAPVAAAGFANCPRRVWVIAGAQRRDGLVPPVNRHPPRDVA